MTKVKNDMKYIKCFDNGGATLDRYMVVFTKRIGDRSTGYYPYASMSAHPYHGFGQHGDFNTYIWPMRSTKHLGKRIAFEDLPEDCQKLVSDDYQDYYGSEQPEPTEEIQPPTPSPVREDAIPDPLWEWLAKHELPEGFPREKSYLKDSPCKSFGHRSGIHSPFGSISWEQGTPNKGEEFGIIGVFVE
jgi:hypothetical protein